MVYRICLIGPPGCGKSSWLKRWIDGTFSEISPTTDMDIRSMTVLTNIGKIHVIAYDVSDRFSYISCHNVDLCISFFDASEPESLYHTIVCKDEFARRYPTIPIFIIGNKIDLGVGTCNAVHMCSVKTGESLRETYDQVLKLLAGDDVHMVHPSPCWIL